MIDEGKSMGRKDCRLKETKRGKPLVVVKGFGGGSCDWCPKGGAWHGMAWRSCRTFQLNFSDNERQPCHATPSTAVTYLADSSRYETRF